MQVRTGLFGSPLHSQHLAHYWPLSQPSVNGVERTSPGMNEWPQPWASDLPSSLICWLAFSWLLMTSPIMRLLEPIPLRDISLPPCIGLRSSPIYKHSPPIWGFHHPPGITLQMSPHRGPEPLVSNQVSPDTGLHHSKGDSEGGTSQSWDKGEKSHKPQSISKFQRASSSILEEITCTTRLTLRQERVSSDLKRSRDVIPLKSFQRWQNRRASKETGFQKHTG